LVIEIAWGWTQWTPGFTASSTARIASGVSFAPGPSASISLAPWV
jgi:hypothetical protein